jgi:class 3 adenylate cyclase/tetratricopeptide (TPR) repeat protein
MIDCPSCGVTNPSEARFCGDCGAPLGTACPQCGAEVPPGKQFCLSCGASLGRPTRLRPTEERKVVTVLFCDLVGFTARSDRADPEDVRARLRPYHARLQEDIERYGGKVEKFLGDGVMAVFGVPAAHEDDPERAVRAALRIQRSIGELNEAQPGLELEARVAVTTGEALVSADPRGEGLVGDVVNSASRLQEIATPGGIVVGEGTFRATRDRIEYQELAPVRVKGKDAPLAIWRAQAARTRYGVDAVEESHTPFVGRETELALLKDAYARAVQDPSVQLVTITGEPGVGKTRLVRELFSHLDARPDVLAWWRQGRCLPYGEGITFWALGEIVKGQAGILESDGREEATEKLEGAVRALVEQPSERDWIATRLAPLVGAEVAESRTGVAQSESFAAWRQFLEAMAAQRPLVMVIEDLHWADPALVQFIEHLLDHSLGVPLLVLCTARPELYQAHPGWGGGKRNSATISLSPLSDEATASLLASLLEQAVLPAETQRLILDRCGGNPLYAREFVRMLEDRGLLERRGRIVKISEDLPIPPSVQGLIAARLDLLPPTQKSLVRAAAVVGKVFWPGTLSAIEDLDHKAVDEALLDLTRRELVRPSRSSSVEGEAEYSFWHLLVRDVAYGQIARAERAEKHRGAAAWIERMAGERVGDHAELLAHHYGQALGLAEAAGLTDLHDLKETTGRFLVMAGDRAFQLDVGRAESYYNQALPLIRPSHPERGRVLTKVGRAAFQAGRYQEGERQLEEAIGALQATGDALGEGEARIWLARHFWQRGEAARSDDQLDQAVRILEGLPRGPELSHAYAHRAAQRALRGRPEEALPLAEGALALAGELSIEEDVVRALHARGLARLDLQDPGGLDDLRQALRRSLEHGLSYWASVSYINLSVWTHLMEGWRAALDLLEAGLEYAHEHGIITLAEWMTMQTLWLRFDRGDWDELLQVGESLIRQDRERGGTQTGLFTMIPQALVLLERGMLEQASRIQEELLPRAREAQDLQMLAPGLAISALVSYALGQTEKGSELTDELLELESLAVRRIELLPLSRVLVAVGEVERAETFLAKASLVGIRHQHDELAGRATLAEARGQLEQALELYLEASRRWSDFGHVPEQAHALFGAGRCLTALGRQEEARGRLEEAREIFNRLKARPVLAEVDAWLERAAALGS